MKLLNTVIEIISEQDDWAIKAASGPQKCGLSKLSGGGNYEKECRALDKDAARQDKIDAKERAQVNKNFLSLSYDKDSFPLDRQTKKQYYQQYQQFMNTNPGLLNDGEGFNTEQKYAIISKVLDYVRNVPQISYTLKLGKKYGLNPKSSLNDVIDVVEKMGGWSSFMNWFNSGGPDIK